MPRTSSLSDSSFVGWCTAPQDCHFFFSSFTQLVCFLKKPVRSQFRLRSHFSENSVKFVATSRLSLSTPVCVRGLVQNGQGRAMGIAAAQPKTALERSVWTEKSEVGESHTEGGTKKHPWSIPVFPKKCMILFIEKGSAWVGQGSTLSCSIQYLIEENKNTTHTNIFYTYSM